MDWKVEDILNIEMGKNDADAETVGQYLIALLQELWIKGEGFSGKRPFGNSGWKYELIGAFVKADVVDGRFDEDDEYLEDYDSKQVEIVMNQVFSYLKTL